MDTFEDRCFKRLGESGVHRAGFMLLALECLEVVQPGLAGDLTLELFAPVEGHPRCISSVEAEVSGRRGHARGGGVGDAYS